MLPFPMGGKRETGSAALGMGGTMLPEQGGWVLRYLQRGVWMPRCPGRESAALPGAEGTTLPGGGTTLPRTGLLSVTSRKGVPQPLLPDLPDCQVAVLPSLPAVLIGLSDCQICRLLSLLYCQARRKRGIPGFLPVWLPCKNLGTRCFGRYLTVNCLQSVQVLRSVFLRRLKNKQIRKICH